MLEGPLFFFFPKEQVSGRADGCHLRHIRALPSQVSGWHVDPSSPSPPRSVSILTQTPDANPSDCREGKETSPGFAGLFPKLSVSLVFLLSMPQGECILPQFTKKCHSPFISKPVKTQLMAHIKVTIWPSLRWLPLSWLGMRLLCLEPIYSGVSGPSGILRWGLWALREGQNQGTA